MNKVLRVLIILFVIVFIFYLGIRYERFSNEINEIGKPEISSTLIRVPNSFDEVFYLTKKRWGITGNHEEKIISVEPYNELTENDKIVFAGENSLLYKIEPKKLIIYTNQKPKIASEIGNNIKVEIIEITDSNWKKNYEKLKNGIQLFE